MLGNLNHLTQCVASFARLLVCSFIPRSFPVLPTSLSGATSALPINVCPCASNDVRLLGGVDGRNWGKVLTSSCAPDEFQFWPAGWTGVKREAGSFTEVPPVPLQLAIQPATLDRSRLP